MSQPASVYAGGAAAYAAIANAIKASGVLVRMENNEFRTILNKCENPVIIHTERKIFFNTSYQYMISYKGFCFFTKSKSPLSLPGNAEIVKAKSIWNPI